MEEITVVIPVNFTDAGRLFGLFEILAIPGEPLPLGDNGD